MLSILRLLLCVLAGASAYELPALAGRRAVLARVAAAVPFAAISAVSAAERTNTNAALGAKWMEAASSNTVLGVAKAEKIGSEPEGGISIGRNAFVDEAGAARQPTAKYSTAEVAAKPLVVGEPPRNEKAMARLLGK